MHCTRLWYGEAAYGLHPLAHEVVGAKALRLTRDRELFRDELREGVIAPANAAYQQATSVPTPVAQESLDEIPVEMPMIYILLLV